jgi:cytoskeletal protein RodZ
MALGQNLVNARKQAGISLEELSKRTNIRASLLLEFEANKFVNAGGDAYARGHLRTIARVLDVSAEELLQQFDEEHAQERRALHDQLAESNVTAAFPEKSKITYKQLVGISMVGIVAIFGISFIVNSTGSSTGNNSGSKTTPTAKPSATASAAPSASASASTSSEVKTYSSGSDVQVKLEAVSGSSWLFVSDAAGITLYSGRATQGETFLFSSTETVNLRVGNAGAVKLTVNGKEVPSIGIDGEVVNLSYGVNS